MNPLNVFIYIFKTPTLRNAFFSHSKLKENLKKKIKEKQNNLIEEDEKIHCHKPIFTVYC